ncbi:response regulator transcription factor [Variovorax sp. KK3]|uniref:response regulator transcription factor n=1 Tax=Variovorax sp. KK3 TaxID=1855728 RepID=UPI00097C6B22|nr:response regulator transcription factor [Variovorax sp. KK3]
MRNPIHVTVVHEDAIVSAGVAAILGECDGISASLAGEQEARRGTADGAARDCALVVADHATAMQMAGSGPRSTERPPPRILVLTHLDREWDVRVAMEAGVHGYLLQKCKPAQLVDAVRTVHAGARYVSSELALKLADCLMRDALTVREMEVLRAMATGATNRRISIALGIADATVKAHVRAILSKVGAGARTEAVAIAVRRGLTSASLCDAALAPSSVGRGWS